jgi:type I site-specific restriction-modification system R (restriction) subunit
LRKEVEKKNIPIYETYYKERIDIDVVEFVNGEPIVCNTLIKKWSSFKISKSNEERHYLFDINQVAIIFH